MIKTVDLLVHAGAPSSRLDDERYKAQADAYLAFQGNTVGLSRDPANAALRNVLHDPSNPPDLDTTVNNLERDSTTIFLDDTQSAYIALDSQLASSSLQIPAEPQVQVPSQDAPDSQRSSIHEERRSPSDQASVPFRLSTTPEDRRSKKRKVNNGASQRSNDGEMIDHFQQMVKNTREDVDEQSGESQTSYLKSPVLDRGTKKRRLKNDLDRETQRAKRILPTHSELSENYNVSRAPTGTQPISSTDKADIANIGTLDESNPSDKTTSELPTSYSLSDITSESSRAKPRAAVSQRSASDPGPGSGNKSPSAVQVASTIPAPGANEIRSQSERSGKTNPPVQATKPASPKKAITQRESNKRQSLNPSDSSEAILKMLPLSFRPPEPEMDCKQYTTHITPTLQNVVEELDNTKQYPPTCELRPLRPLERGHWLVDCSSWALQAQISFWQFLGTVILRGAAGWGVWCVRGDGETPDERTDAIGLVKVFCWGEVVKHVYFLLWVASKAQVRKLGIRWIDAERRVVVRMPEL